MAGRTNAVVAAAQELPLRTSDEIQGNILAGDAVVANAEAALIATPGDLSLKVMAAMEAARATGGDGRCSCNQPDPTACGAPPPSFTYSAFTAYCGFEVNEGEYKLMGMHPYGQPRYVDKIYELLHVADDGSVWHDMRYFAYHWSPDTTLNPETRRLSRVEYGLFDFAATVDAFNKLMGKGEAASRRELMELHGDAVEIDV